MRTRSSLGFALLFLLPGCSGSGLADPSQPAAPLAKIQGSLKTLPQEVISGSLRIELAWFVAGGSSDQPRIIGQDIPVTAQLPADFTLPLSGPPPAAALWTTENYPADGGTLGWTVWQTVAPTANQSFAVAQLVAYEDLNGNGALDMVGADATSAPDRIVEGYPGFVLYATNGYGTDAFAPSGTSKDGYGFLLPGVTGTNAPVSPWSSVANDVTLFPTPAEWNLLMCTNFDPLVEYNTFEVNFASTTDPLLSAPLGIMSLAFAPVATDDVIFPPVGQPLLRCTPGGTQYCITACPAPQNQFYVCQTDDTRPNPSDLSSPFYCAGNFGGDPVCYTMPDTEPAGWPCTYTAGVDCAPDPTFNRCADAGVPPIPGDDAGTSSDASSGAGSDADTGG